MSIDDIATQLYRGWTKRQIGECLYGFITSYTDKHGGAFHHAAMHGNYEDYANRETKVLTRWVRRYAYKNNLPPLEELNH